MACEHDTKDCQCCPGDAKAPALYNRPGLPALRYRISEYGHFLQHMLGKLQKPVPRSGDILLSSPLQKLATREPDDHTIALVDAWAVAGDVLTFYQERIANEGFLRTATERRSVLELASEIGYQLSPGVAAETDLAFLVEEITNPSEVNPITLPDRVTIPVGTQVMSMPQGEELPQIFETLEPIEARPAWNSLRPLLGTDQTFASATDSVWLEGTALNLKPGMRLLLVEGTNTEVLVIKTAVVDRTNGMETTKVTFTSSSSIVGSIAMIPAMTTSSYGFDAGTVSTLLSGSISGAQLESALYTNNLLSADVLSFNASLISPGSPLQVHVFRERSGVFGNNAPKYTADLGTAVGGSDWENAEAWKDMAGNYWSDGDIFLDRQLEKVEAGSFVALETSSGIRSAYGIATAVSKSQAEFAMSAKVTGLSLIEPATGGTIGNSVTDKPTHFKMRNTTVYHGSEQLLLARKPVTDDVAAGTELALDTLVLGLSLGQRIVLRGELADAANVIKAEGRAIAAISHTAGRTVLTLDMALANVYKRSTVKVMANVVRASHGETVQQVIGSGDASVPHQRFILPKPKLTHVQGATVSGRESTLTVRVDGVAWTPVSSLYGRKDTEKVYITRIDDDAKARIRFGDGKMGARVPTGQVNIEARYRSGIGLEGEVAANTLTLLKSKPYGVKSVINPVAADGAEDPETLATARSNAPLTVRTLDRVVSLFDYEDFAAAFAGIGKAQALELWNGYQELVHITVLDPLGGVVPDEQLELLRQAITTYRDPYRRFRCDNGVRWFFSLEVNVLIDPAYLWADVEAAMRTSLTTAFAYDRRAFGQPATRAEVMEVMHAVAGVVMVDIDRMDRDNDALTDAGTVLPSRIAAYHAATPSAAASITSAAILLINPEGIQLNQLSDAT